MKPSDGAVGSAKGCSRIGGSKWLGTADILTSDADVTAYVAVMHEICPNFDEEPTLKAVLDGSAGTPAERWQALFADTPELALAWERAAYPTFYDYRAWLPADER